MTDARRTTRRQRLGVAILAAGVVGGAFGAGFLALLHLLTTLLVTVTRDGWVRVLMLTATGAAVTLVTRWFGPAGSVELLVDNIHVHGGHHALRSLRSPQQRHLRARIPVCGSTGLRSRACALRRLIRAAR